LIIPLSNFVIREGCRQNQAWQERSSAPIRLAINITASHLRNEMLFTTVSEVLDETRLDPRYLELELTETALIGDEKVAAKVIGQLARLGILFSIDDFGTGYSSLKYLKQLSIQKLKIDQSFVRNLPHDPDDAIIVRATIALGHQLGLRVIAEGVETEDQLVFLREHGCDEGQGYFFHRPLPPEEMGALLESSGVFFSRPVQNLVPA
jgi:EAL domain-containing protein (putative c-di-GMP-specific phosphodiesterase class I)